MSELGLFHHPTLAATHAALQACVTQHGDAPTRALVDSIERFSSAHHGDFAKWRDALQALPNIAALETALDLTVTVAGAATDAQVQALEQSLLQLSPWRKGPFELFGIAIDTEWRSDWKWQRLAPRLGAQPQLLYNARVLDVGCGNGYFGWQLRRQGAASVIGIDPTLLFCMQHLAINRYLQDDGNWVLPLRLEELPAIEPGDQGFDGVLSMGVLYHRRDPAEHLTQLYEQLRPGGWLVLESLVVPGDAAIYPGQDGGRYARMRNVWCVPTVNMLAAWLRQAGLQDIELLDDSVTTIEEQQRTRWMPFESLVQSLDPADHSHTIEGWPAPQRAMLFARRPV